MRVHLIYFAADCKSQKLHFLSYVSRVFIMCVRSDLNAASAGRAMRFSDVMALNQIFTHIESFLARNLVVQVSFWPFEKKVEERLRIDKLIGC